MSRELQVPSLLGSRGASLLKPREPSKDGTRGGICAAQNRYDSRPLKPSQSP